jgi:hypothetical protein
MAMAVRRKPLDAAIGRLLTPYCQFGHRNAGVVQAYVGQKLVNSNILRVLSYRS